MIYSLRWQLFFSMLAVILVVVGAVAFVASRAASAEIERVQARDDIARTRRLNTLLVREYLAEREWSGAQRIVENAGEIFGRRVVLINQEGIVVADSHHRALGRQVTPETQRRAGVPVAGPQGRLGTLLFDPSLALGQSTPPAVAQEAPGGPSLTTILVFSGMLAVVLAVVLTFFLSRRILAPVEAVARASRLAAGRDFSVRAEVRSRDEVGELARTFNSMVEELSRSEEMRRNLVADVAHELRTPVTNIRAYIEGIADGVVTPTAATFDLIHGETLLLTRLIQDLQDLALAESGQMRLRLQPCDLAEVVQSAVTAVSPSASEKGITLLTGDLPQTLLMADPERIGQVLRNLLTNAVAYTPAGGEVRIGMEEPGEGLAVTVQDTGPGIPAEDLPHVFDRFYRVDKSRSRATGGVGLGLTIARHLVEAHGGQIEASSREGQGAEFRFTLPKKGLDA